MKQKNSNIFWASYADLMTALFIVALVLFVLSYKLFRDKEQDYLSQAEELRLRNVRLAEQEKLATNTSRSLLLEKSRVDSLLSLISKERDRIFVLEEEFKKLQEIEKSISNLDPRYFEYQPKFKRHVLKAQVQFNTGSSSIPNEYDEMLINAGKAIEGLISEMDSVDNIKYTLIIEGQSSKDDYSKNFELSYERALSLKRLWDKNDIQFDPQQCEVMISGSGTGGIGRNQDDEKKNQRFLIQIIPKVGTIDLPRLDIKELTEESKSLLD